MTYYFAIFAPLLGFILNQFCQKDIYSKIITCSLMFISVLCSFTIFQEVALRGVMVDAPLMTWIQVGNFDVKWSLHFDTLSVVMIMVVSLVSFLVHLYSLGYMQQDPSIKRFMGYLSLFTFMMFALVTAKNFIQLFFGWEGVGLASYLLIGFWYNKPSANAAAIKAFVVNRVGDAGLVLGIGAIFLTFNTLDFNEIFAQVPHKTNDTITWFHHSFSSLDVICFLLLVGAMGKSAQIGFHTWLPDAMEGPTPVSALIHAATMVTAGVFLIVKCSPLFQQAPSVNTLMTIVGATTAFFAGTIALTQNDIKRVIAYSTCSQLGYMFFACGLSAYHVAMFHLVTHAFFKALLFLGAGAVIHSMSDEQDMRAMGGIWRLIPLTYVLMIVGSLALAGIPYFSGYYSKDAILETAWLAQSWVGDYAYILGIGAAFLTAFYSWRLLCLTFNGKPRAGEMVMSHVHESSFIMVAPLFVLAIGAIFSGYWGLPYFMNKDFWQGSLIFTQQASHAIPEIIEWLPTLVALSGIALAYVLYLYKNQWPKKIATRFSGLYRFFLNKWYFDELYQKIFVERALKIGDRLWQTFDRKIIDGWGPDGVSDNVLKISSRISHWQTGYLSTYAYGMVLGVAILIGFLILK
ncbi:MAG: NADH-quinone oxidoreductase subunit L [Janthinobacterium lividum]